MDLVTWVAPTPAETPLPDGWDDASVAVVGQMADALHVDPLDMLALFESESGLQPHIKPAGLAGLTSIVEVEMGWPSGTIAQLIAGPTLMQLQAIFALWAHVQDTYAGGSFAAKAKAWGVPTGAVLYAYHGFLRGALSASGPASVLADHANDPGGVYAGNPGLDIGNKGTITVGDLVARIAQKKTQLQGYGPTNAVWQRLRSLADLPSGIVPSLSSFFASIRPAWRALTGRDVRTSAAANVGVRAAGEGALLGAQGGSPSTLGPLLFWGAVVVTIWAVCSAKGRRTVCF